MRGRRAWSLSLASVAATVGLVLTAAGASAAPLPTLYTTENCTSRCVPVYAVRPRQLFCQQAAGGELTLTWSSWTPTEAVGAGISTVAHQGVVSRTRVTVVALSPRAGRFSRLRVRLAADRQPFELQVTPSPGFKIWEPVP
jgi:hypothetical protein